MACPQSSQAIEHALEQVSRLEPEVLRVPQLPRAAGGGAGAVAAFVLIAEPGAPEPALSVTPEPRSVAGERESIGTSAATPAEPSPAEAGLTTDDEPHPVAAGDRLSPEEPSSAQATAAAPVPLMAERASGETASAGDLAPQEVAALHEPAPAEPASVETQALQDVAPPPEGEPQTEHPAAQPMLGETDADPDRGPAVPCPPVTGRAQPPLLELIPEVQPSQPKLPALSPSVARVLRPMQLEPARSRESNALRHIEPPAPQSEPAAPPVRTPIARAAEPVASLPSGSVVASPAAAPRANAVPAPPPGSAIPLPLPSREGLPVERRHLRRELRVALTLLVTVAGLLLALLVLYRWVDPPTSTLMLGQRLAGTPISQRWVPLERISPNLSAAVISSEDGHFCRHHGVDWGELKEAIESTGDGIARGGSTISMQVIKNLFLWPSRSYVRKAIEIPLAYAMEALWPKRRILEIYLNIAEWGPGVFGAEAAARYHFRKPALLLSPREAALLAVSLPNPFERQAGRPGPGTLRLADNLLLRMRAAQANTACVRATADTRPGTRSVRG